MTCETHAGYVTAVSGAVVSLPLAIRRGTTGQYSTVASGDAGFFFALYYAYVSRLALQAQEIAGLAGCRPASPAYV